MVTLFEAEAEVVVLAERDVVWDCGSLELGSVGEDVGCEVCLDFWVWVGVEGSVEF